MVKRLQCQKALLFLSDASYASPFDSQNVISIRYHSAPPPALRLLKEQITSELKRWRHSPRLGRPLTASASALPFFVDWNRLDYQDIENLCRELLVQMGFRRVEWQKASNEFDLIAELPKKDPDGFEYTELWLVSLGKNASFGMLFDIANHYDPEMMLRRLFRDEVMEKRGLLDRDNGVSLTILMILLHNHESAMEAKEISDRINRRKRKSLTQLRVRVWDRDYVTALVHQFPQIGYKYFSDEARSLAKFRKGPEELYSENIILTERLQKTVSDLQEERNLRIRAERDAVWKDISFSAAHKIGNPIFAIETDLEPLRRRIIDGKANEAIAVTTNMQSAVEKAKGIVEQFKSLTKAQQVKLVPMPLLPSLEDIVKMLHGHEVQCTIKCDPGIAVEADPERFQEVLDELATNAMHWIGTKPLDVKIDVELPTREGRPSSVDASRDYVLIRFKDNGIGIAEDKKEKIFDAFFTTYDHGTGLGLALVRRIIEGHGGVVREVGLAGQGAQISRFICRDQRGSRV